MAAKSDAVTTRENLKPRHAPYFYKIKAECHIGFRKTTAASFGTWLARFCDDKGVYQIKSLGSLEQHPSYRRFDAAVALAEPTFVHRQAGGSAVSYTVGEVCQQFADKQRINGKEKTAKELEGRFKRWMTPDKKTERNARRQIDERASQSLARQTDFIASDLARQNEDGH